MHDQIRIDALLKEAAQPFIDQPDGPKIIFDAKHLPSSSVPVILRRPEIIYGLRNFVENAVRFAVDEVRCTAHWDDACVFATICDDGPGFASDVLARLGEPYINPKLAGGRNQNISGMGLGFFIAKTLLERTGATVIYGNGIDPGYETSPRLDGAVVSVRWPISALSPRSSGHTAAMPA